MASLHVSNRNIFCLEQESVSVLFTVLLIHVPIGLSFQTTLSSLANTLFGELRVQRQPERGMDRLIPCHLVRTDGMILSTM